VAIVQRGVGLGGWRPGVLRGGLPRRPLLLLLRRRRHPLLLLLLLLMLLRVLLETRLHPRRLCDMLLLLLLMLGLLREHIPHDCRLRVQRTDHSSGDAHVTFAALAASERSD
jgi:hypothetical protein